MKTITAIIIWAASCIVSLPLHAAMYYVDTASDGGNGTTTALSGANAAFKTIAAAQAAITGDQSDNSLLFCRGKEWLETLTIGAYGTSGHPFTIGAYGSGAKPIIKGTTTVSTSGWSVYSGNIYVKTVGAINPAYGFFIDGVYHDVARYPNSGWLSASSTATNTTSIIDTTLAKSEGEIVGASVTMRTIKYRISIGTITSFNTGTGVIGLAGNVYDGSTLFPAGNGYVLSNKLWMLDSPGEWFYDSADGGKLYVWTADGDSPENHTIEYASRDRCVDINGKANVTVENLDLRNPKYQCIRAVGASSNINLLNIDTTGGATNVYGNIYFETVTGGTIQHCTSTNASCNGIDVSTSTNINILDNNVINAGSIGEVPHRSFAAINIMTSTGSNISRNTVINAGAFGVISIGANALINRNYIDTACKFSLDCGGIYTYGRTGDLINTRISYNVIKDVIGYLPGTTNTEDETYAIYLDDWAHDNIVANNTVVNGWWGMIIHSGYSNQIYNNAFIKSRKYAFVLTENHGSPGVCHSNTAKNNIFETLHATEPPVYYYQYPGNDITGFGLYDKNTYYHPNTSKIIRGEGTYYTLTEWQAAYPTQDIVSTHYNSGIDIGADLYPPLDGITINGGTFVPGVHDQPGCKDMTGNDCNSMAIPIGAYSTVEAQSTLKGLR